MSKRTQRELFLVTTIMGLFVTIPLVLFGVFSSVQAAPEVLAEIGRRDGSALALRAKTVLPLSVVGGIVFVGTLFLYRCYHRLAFPK
jgi:hypothetical protein